MAISYKLWWIYVLFTSGGARRRKKIWWSDQFLPKPKCIKVSTSMFENFGWYKTSVGTMLKLPA